MTTDYHNHLLPAIDDGARDMSESVEILRHLCAGGVKTVYCTPHYHAHTESTGNFLKRRDPALEAVRAEAERLGLPIKLRGAAEVRLERGLAGCEGLRRLCYEGTDRILIELPYTKFERWMPEEIFNISVDFGITPVIAHLNRYFIPYSREELSEILGIGGIVIQINVEAFSGFHSRRKVKEIRGEGYEIVLGTDLHRRDGIRAVNFDRIGRAAAAAGLTV